MFQPQLHQLNAVPHRELTRVICVARYNNKWVFCKHKKRDTWELPGGHIEPGEDWITAGKREMYEETGATKLKLKPVALYSVSTYGIVCLATIEKLEKLPMSEIEKIELFDDIPKNLTYPETHTLLFETVKKFIER